MQAYRAKYEHGVVIPFGNPVIPEGSEIILTILDASVPESAVKKQRRAINRFLEEMQTCDETLSPEFDAIISQRMNLSREVDI
jgi:predicted DNA-binding antitoxin AbrB/MazE fold protein